MREPILPRVAKNEPGAASECIARYEGLVWSLVRRFCRNRADAEDAVQDVFIEIWRSAGRYNPLLASEATFVGVIARRELIDRCRTQRRRAGETFLGDQQEQVQRADPATLEVREEAKLASRSVAKLGASEQLVLSLAIDRGITHTGIAKVTGMPVGTVKTHVRRGLMKLRWMMDAQGGRGQGRRHGGNEFREVRTGAA